MSNQLVIPFKRTSQPPIEDAVHDYLAKYHPEIIPDVFSWDISHWLSLRAEISGSLVHGTVVDTFLKSVRSSQSFARGSPVSAL